MSLTRITFQADVVSTENNLAFATTSICRRTINSKEQIFTEKLRSILRFGPLSTRFKDVFDMCYLSDYVDHQRLEQCMNTYIFSDPDMRENDMDAIRVRVQRTFADRTYRQRLERSHSSNWMGITVSEALERITEFLNAL